MINQEVRSKIRQIDIMLVIAAVLHFTQPLHHYIHESAEDALGVLFIVILLCIFCHSRDLLRVCSDYKE